VRETAHHLAGILERYQALRGARPAWRPTELASHWRADAAGESSHRDTGEVREGAGGFA
jgi:hypothetical protein